MKELYLIRHAKSDWGNPQLKDFDRPLNKRGLQAAPEMGRRMADKNLKPNVMVSSEAARAIATARLIREQFNRSIEIIEESKLYHASTFLLLEVVNAFEDQWNSVFVVGHNPGLTDFAQYLTNDHFGNLPTTAIVGIRFEVDSWAEVSSSSGHCFLYDYPKNED